MSEEKVLTSIQNSGQKSPKSNQLLFDIQEIKSGFWLLKVSGKATSKDPQRILSAIEKVILPDSEARLIIDLEGFQKFPLSERKMVFERFWSFRADKRIAFTYLINANTFIKMIAMLIGTLYKDIYFDFADNVEDVLRKFQLKKQQNSNVQDEISEVIQYKKSNNALKIINTQTFHSRKNHGSKLICTTIYPNIVLYEYVGVIDMSLAENYMPYAKKAYNQVGKFHFIVDLKDSTKVTKETREYYNKVTDEIIPMVYWNYYNLTPLFSVLYKIYGYINPGFVKSVKVIQSVPETINFILADIEVKENLQNNSKNEEFLSEIELESLDKQALIQYINVLQSELKFQKKNTKKRTEDMFKVLSKITWSGNFDKLILPEVHESDEFYNVYKSIELLKQDVGELIEELRSTNQNLESIVEERTKEIFYKESNLRAIIENFQTPIWLIDKEYRILEYNTLFSNNMINMFDVHLEKGKNILESFSKDIADFWKKRYDICLKGESKNYYEPVEFPEEQKYFEIKTFPIYNKKEILGVGVVAIDITDLHNSKEKLQDQNLKLSKLNNELDSFIYRSSHDLRAPISSVKGLIDISKMEKDPSKKEQYLDMMEKTMDKLDGFIHEIVDITKNEKLELSFEKFNLNNLVETILEELGHKQSINKIQIENNIDLGLYIKSDENRLKTVFKNIIANSIKYRDENKSSFIKIHSIDQKNQIIVLFEDNGVGIKEEYIPKLTTMFYRAHPNKSGSGLGLYIVSEILEKLEGKIEFESDFGKSTKVKLSLKK